MPHWLLRLGAPVLTTVLVASCAYRGPAARPESTATPPAQPYAGVQQRPIKALAPERVADLLAGRGAGYALAAELNHYPGPRHVLDLAGPLQLTPDQERATRAIFAAMEQGAQRLGRQLIDLEAELDRAFGSGQITAAEVTRLTAEIGRVEGQVRATHLAAHLQVKGVLTAEQVARYDQVRGYTAPGTDRPSGSGEHPGGHHGEQPGGTAAPQP